ncbi:MAG: ammonia-forming cytochrome c nitrite reductase subunit c552 [Ignavibacteriae bacterium]|nr:ammonia-forming cytochrome c nitrite reductase subunit c552 [Ignavibacteriota bacterium]
MPTAANVRGNFTATVNMGAAAGGATVELRGDANGYFAKLMPVGGGTPVEYPVLFLYGFGWKQRYLVKIENSLYILPIQWNLKGYLDNSSGTWVSYNPNTWFNADGSLKAVNNAFRTKSYDKNCAGCHVTGLGIVKNVVGTDTSWTASWGANTTIEDMVTGCENCHGPGAAHAAAPSSSNIKHPGKFSTKEQRLEVCGQCHFRGSSSAGTYEYPWDEANNKTFLDKLGEESLSGYIKFKPGVWVDNVTARQHHQQYNDILISKHFTNTFVEVNCVTCHDPHRVTSNKHQVVEKLKVGSDEFSVKNEDNTLCLACHATFGPFANVTKDMVKNPVANKAAIGAVVSQHTKHSYDPDGIGTGKCSSCHMTKVAVTANSYDIHSHNFAVLPPSLTITYKGSTTPTKGMINSCAAACHRNGQGAASLGVGADATLTDWTEATDQALADTLDRAWKKWFGTTDVKQLSIAAGAFLLQQNYPNPFNPSTVIEYSLPRTARVVLRVYDMTGAHVRTLVDEQQLPGMYRATFDASGLPSGTYFYRLEAGSASLVKKMALMK